MRLFVALPLPEALRAQLGAMTAGLPGARWVAPENLHVTLRFIGEADSGQARDIDAELAQVRAESFPVTLAGIDRFGSGARVRTLWAGVEANSALERLYGSIEQALQDAGLPPEGRRFKPHVTLARFKASPGARLSDYLARHAPFRAEPFQAESFVLYSSFLSQSGAIYTEEAAYPLGPAGTL
ncbi:MAG: RNA 2',3'-cyclic phosphodiesterase [Kiloniellales bacterium]